MADPLYLSLWFSESEAAEILVSALSVLRQFPFAKAMPGITNLALHPVSWNEATILERRFSPGATPEEAIAIAADLLHEDYAYVFEANWDLWTPAAEGAWGLQPAPVKLIARGAEFEEGEAEAQGQLQVDFGLDPPFLYEELELTAELESRVRANVQMLVDFITRVERNVPLATRLLWSESDENLAQKLVSRLQRVH
ncbi:MAG TPA: hypothetical protein VFB00_07400 [Terriglobales bacterium]|nr:hypothetical protein [Terriglobales bacterium]